MTTLNETLTLGLVLVLLFGSICLYLYTRIQQNEQKLNLVESILIDLKMTTEVKSYPDLPAPMQSSPAPAHVTVEMKEMPDEDLAPGATVVVNELPTMTAVSESESIPISSETVEVFQSSSSDEAHVETGSVKVGANYTSMTQTELRALAKQRHISGASGMRRQQLIEALQTSDRAEESGAPAPMEPFLGGEVTSIVSIPA
jgi:hypothetical protein